MPRGIPNPRRVNAKLCYGPSHAKPSWEPYSNFNRVKGKIWYECRDCHAHRRRIRGMDYSHYPFSKVEFAIVEIVRRVGKAEASRRIGVSKQTICKWTNHSPQSVRRETAIKIFKALIKIRITQEVRDRKSILTGAELRGRPVKKPYWHIKHYYSNASDEESQRRRVERRSNRQAVSS